MLSAFPRPAPGRFHVVLTQAWGKCLDEAPIFAKCFENLRHPPLRRELYPMTVSDRSVRYALELPMANDPGTTFA